MGLRAEKNCQSTKIIFGHNHSAELLDQNVKKSEWNFSDDSIGKCSNFPEKHFN